VRPRRHRPQAGCDRLRRPIRPGGPVQRPDHGQGQPQRAGVLCVRQPGLTDVVPTPPSEYKSLDHLFCNPAERTWMPSEAPPMANLRPPLYDWHLAHKARIVPFGGWDMPVQYTSILDEHQAVRAAAGFFDVSHMGRLSFGGPDAMALIQKVWTNDASKMKDWQGRYGLLCKKTGGTLEHGLG